MKKVKRKIRYKYREEKEGFLLKNVRCPICKSNHINWIKVVEHTSWAGKVKLLAECWSGNTREEKPSHLFLIELTDLPIVEINKIKPKKEIRVSMYKEKGKKKKVKLKASGSFKKKIKKSKKGVKK